MKRIIPKSGDGSGIKVLSVGILKRVMSAKEIEDLERAYISAKHRRTAKEPSEEDISLLEEWHDKHTSMSFNQFAVEHGYSPSILYARVKSTAYKLFMADQL